MKSPREPYIQSKARHLSFRLNIGLPYQLAVVFVLFAKNYGVQIIRSGIGKRYNTRYCYGIESIVSPLGEPPKTKPAYLPQHRTHFGRS